MTTAVVGPISLHATESDIEMDAQLLIESDEACRLADELSRLTGKDVATTVTMALREKLEREHLRAEKMAKLREIAAEIRADMKGPVSSNHDWLYDEDGLPR